MKKRRFTEKEVLNLAKNAYENGDANFKIKSENCVLLVIDMQDEFVKPYWTPYWVPEATHQVPKIKMLIDYCRNKKIPVIYTMFSKTNNYNDRPNTGKYMPNRFSNLNIDQSEYFVNGKIYKELTPEPEDVVICKPSYGAFYNTSLETILRNLKRDTIIICGTLTNYCCGTTARQGYERGFKVVFGSDITSTDDQSMQEPELKVLRKGFAKVLNLKKIIELI